MTRYFVDVSPDASQNFKEIVAGFYSLNEKESPVVFSGYYLNSTGKFTDIIARDSVLEWKGVLWEEDEANAFLASKRRAVGSAAQVSLLYFSDKDPAGGGFYNATARKATVIVTRFEKTDTDVLFEGELRFDKDTQAKLFKP